MNEKRFFIGTDESSHNYIVPLERQAEWFGWTEIPEDDERAWTAPDYAVRLNGHYGRISFTDWRQES